MQKILLLIHLLGLCVALQAVAMEAPFTPSVTVSVLTNVHALTATPSADDVLTLPESSSHAAFDLLELSELDEDFLLLHAHQWLTPPHQPLHSSHFITRCPTPVINSLDRPPQGIHFLLI